MGSIASEINENFYVVSQHRLSDYGFEKLPTPQSSVGNQYMREVVNLID